MQQITIVVSDDMTVEVTFEGQDPQQYDDIETALDDVRSQLMPEDQDMEAAEPMQLGEEEPMGQAGMTKGMWNQEAKKRGGM